MAKKATVTASKDFVLTMAHVSALEAIATATKGEQGFLFTPGANDSTVKELADNGYVEINTDMRNDAGYVATRATETGLEVGSNSDNEDNTGDGDDDAFEIELTEQYVPDPADRKRGARLTPKEEKYPFSKLPAPQTNADGKVITAKFFVADPSDKKDKDGKPLTAIKSLASTVSAASKRFSKETGEFRTINRKVMEPFPAMNDDGTAKHDEHGKPVMLEREVTKPVQVPVLEYERVFKIFPGEKNGVKGAFIERVK